MVKVFNIRKKSPGRNEVLKLLITTLRCERYTAALQQPQHLLCHVGTAAASGCDHNLTDIIQMAWKVLRCAVIWKCRRHEFSLKQECFILYWFTPEVC